MGPMGHAEKPRFGVLTSVRDCRRGSNPAQAERQLPLERDVVVRDAVFARSRLVGSTGAATTRLRCSCSSRNRHRAGFS